MKKKRVKYSTNHYTPETHPGYKIVYRDTGEDVDNVIEVDLLSIGMIIKRLDIIEDDRYMLLDDEGNEVKWHAWAEAIKVE